MLGFKYEAADLTANANGSNTSNASVPVHVHDCINMNIFKVFVDTPSYAFAKALSNYLKSVVREKNVELTLCDHVLMRSTME